MFPTAAAVLPPLHLGCIVLQAGAETCLKWWISVNLSLPFSHRFKIPESVEVDTVLWNLTVFEYLKNKVKLFFSLTDPTTYYLNVKIMLGRFHSVVPFYRAPHQLPEIIHVFFPSSTQQLHQAGEPVFYLHKHMAHSCWFHTSGKWTGVSLVMSS